jgi:hypothetical protein
VKPQAPFCEADLAEMDDLLLSRASAVVAMEDVHDGHRDPSAIGLRHDVDGMHARTSEALGTAVKIAEWEEARGYRATFYLLHTAPYWNSPGFAAAVDRIAECGHEIGIHTDALAESLKTGRDPDQILDDALWTLRGLGHRVRGVAGHGNPICNRDAAPGEISFANDEQFIECARPQEGPPNRTITRGNVSLTLKPHPLADFGLEYEALKCAYGPGIMPFRISDSGGRWLNPGWEETVEKWNRERAENPGLERPTKDVRQLHFLWHPDWWQHSFPARVAA